MKKSSVSTGVLTYMGYTYYSPERFAANNGVTPASVYNWIKAGMTSKGAVLETILMLDKTFVRIK
jgi:hypothetical protein